VPNEDGLYYSIDYMYPIKDLDNRYLGKIGHIASLWLGGRSVPTEDGLYLFFNKVISCFFFFIICIE
jgi:hypothetical protein